MATDVKIYQFKGYNFSVVICDEITDYINQYGSYVELISTGAVGGHGIITEAGTAFKNRFRLDKTQFTLATRSYDIEEGLTWILNNYFNGNFSYAFVSSVQTLEDTSYGEGRKITQYIDASQYSAFTNAFGGYLYIDDANVTSAQDAYPLGCVNPSPAVYNQPPLKVAQLGFFVYNSTGTVGYFCSIDASYTGVTHVNFKSQTGSVLKNFFDPLTPTEVDPYTQAGTTQHGGGTGTFSHTGDDISVPNLPTLGATDAGLVTLFVPSTGELRSLGNYMWSASFDLETFKKIFANPIDCILGLSIVPVSVPTGSSSSVHVGNIDTGVSMSKASTQYVEVDCGTLSIQEYWGSYLDYAPYTKAEIYLPYVGAHAISVDDIMASSVQVVYHVDILSGACVAFVKCGNSVLYSFNGQCSASIPICARDWTNVINGVMQIAGSIGTMVATGGLTAPASITSTASAVAQNAISAKPEIEKSGSLSGTGGMLGIQTPYLIITYPKQALPSKQNTFSGYPSHITTTLASISGFTIIESGHFEFMSCTQTEINEIENLLKGGVFV